MSNPNPPISQGDIAFYDNYIPSLDDGIYTIHVQSEIEGTDTGDYFKEPITQQFQVRGPQFSLPADEVHSCYPPANGNSTYDQYLPNIVLNKRALPWERYFDPGDKKVPWLCLLVFKEGEIAVDPKTRSPLKSALVTQFLSDTDDTLAPSIPLTSIPADVQQSQCAYIQVEADAFLAVAPKIDELEYLAHVRQVDTGDQAVMGMEDEGWFSVVTGNRLLKTSGAQGQRFYVHLVSLEGYYDLLSNPSSWPKKGSDPSTGKAITLASLYNWTFLSQPETLNFRQLVENFVTQAGGNPDNLLLRRYPEAPADPDPATKTALERFANGYVPLNYQTPAGETTFAWYRSPLTPVIAQPLPRPDQNYHYPSADALMIYDAANGVFDQSYAAAWSMGRALALADGAFAQALFTFRRNAYAVVGQLLDNLESIGDATKDDLAQIVQQSVVRDTFKSMLTAPAGAAFAKQLQAPAAPRGKRIVKSAAAENPVDAAKAFLGQPQVQALLTDQVREELEPIAAWIAQKQLLQDIPFDHLVPDQSMLPAESLRFFYLDQNWLDALADGALSIGFHSSKEAFYTQAMKGVIDDAVAFQIKTMRDNLLGKATGDTEADSPLEAMSGILIRSAVVSGWPGLTVQAFKGDFQGTRLKTLRMERLSANVLLCIFLDIPDTVMLAEPQQGLCFGVEDGQGDDQIIQLRQLANPPGKPTGKNFPASDGFASFFRPATGNLGDDVLNINDGSKSVVQTMGQSQYLNTALTPAQFAMEMVKAPEALSFQPKSS